MRYKVFNNNDFGVGIRLENPVRELSIKANTFIMMDEDDILYTNSVSKLFEKGVIYVEEQDMLEKMGYIEKNPNTISETEIVEILEMNNARLKREISKITEDHAISKVVAVIKNGKVDLSLSKIKIVDDALGIDVNNILKETEDEEE